MWGWGSGLEGSVVSSPKRYVWVLNPSTWGHTGLGWALNPMSAPCRSRDMGRWGRRLHDLESEVGVRQLQAKEHQRWLNRKKKQRLFPSAFRGSMSLPVWGFWPPELWDNTLMLFQAPRSVVCILAVLGNWYFTQGTLSLRKDLVLGTGRVAGCVTYWFSAGLSSLGLQARP